MPYGETPRSYLKRTLGKNQKCPWCGKGFQFFGDMKRHVLTNPDCKAAQAAYNQDKDDRQERELAYLSGKTDDDTWEARGQSMVKHYWEEAEKQYDDLATQRKAKVGDKWAYVVGAVKTRLGLESLDLLLVGMPPEVICESVLTEVSPVPNANAQANMKKWVCPNCNTSVTVPIGETPKCPKCQEPKMASVQENAMSLLLCYEGAIFGTLSAP